MHSNVVTMLLKEVRNMNENDIRKILTAYFRDRNSKVRIYKEKAIGGSICDLMVVPTLFYVKNIVHASFVCLMRISEYWLALRHIKTMKMAGIL